MESSLSGKCHPISLWLSAFGFVLSGYPPTGPLDRVLSQQHPHLPSNCAPAGSAASLPKRSSPLLSRTRIVTHLHTSWLMKTCSFAVCLYKFPHFVYHHSMISSHIPQIPLLPDPSPMNPNTTYNIFFFFFFQNSPIHKHWHAFFQTHIEKHDHVIFVRVFFMFSSGFFFFCSFSWSRTDYVHTDVICRWQNQWHADMDNAQHMSGEQRKIKAWKMEILGGWPTDWDRDQTSCSCAWKWDPSLFLEQQDACTNSVFCHRQPDYIAEGKTFWVQHVVF